MITLIYAQFLWWHYSSNNNSNRNIRAGVLAPVALTVASNRENWDFERTSGWPLCLSSRLNTETNVFFMRPQRDDLLTFEPVIQKKSTSDVSEGLVLLSYVHWAPSFLKLFFKAYYQTQLGEEIQFWEIR